MRKLKRVNDLPKVTQTQRSKKWEVNQGYSDFNTSSHPMTPQLETTYYHSLLFSKRNYVSKVCAGAKGSVWVLRTFPLPFRRRQVTSEMMTGFCLFVSTGKVPQAVQHGQKNINKQKDNSQNGRKYMQIIYLIRDLYPKYIKNSTIKDKWANLKNRQRI